MTIGSTVRLERPEPGVVLVTLDRPERLNAMNFELVCDLHAALDEAGSDRSCRVVVLTGSGRGFCAGLDLKGAGTPPGTEGLGFPQAGLKGQALIAGLVPHLRALHQPVIAAVNGPAAGGGFALALGADLRVAAASARFNVAFVRIGLSGCDVGVSYLLPRIVGAAAAAELMLTGRLIDAEEAHRLGLVLEVVPDGEVVEAALRHARRIMDNSPFGVWMTKEVLWRNLDAPSLEAAIDLENRTQLLASLTEDAREARIAFLERRPPRYTDR
jgi:enoyl-CoA hydratase